jgi:uncharacterized membrane protein
MPFEIKLTLFQIILCWFALGFVGSLVLLFEKWYSEKVVTASDVVIASMSMVFGIILLGLSVIALFLKFLSKGDPIIIHGKKDIEE